MLALDKKKYERLKEKAIAPEGISVRYFRTSHPRGL